MKKLILTGLIVALLDQISKFVMKNYFTSSENYGAAFGVLPGARWVFVIVAFLVIFFVFKYRNEYNNVALGFLLGGVVGNLIDRLFRGYVIDFIDLGFWPSFNLADSFSTIGVLLLIYLHWKD